MTQTNTNKTKQQLEQEKRQNARKVSNLYTHDIVKEFSQHMEERNANFFSLPKDELVRKFEEFIQQEYDDNILEALKDGKVSGKPLDIEFSALIQKGFTLSDFLDSKKGQVIKENFSRSVTEQQAIQKGLLTLHKRWQDLPHSLTNKLKISDFVSSIGYRSLTNTAGEVIEVLPGHYPKSHTVQTLAFAWKEYLRSELTDPDQIKDYTDLLDFEHFDPTEKVVSISAVHELYDHITRKIKGENKNQLLSLAEEIFGYDKHAVYSDVSWTTMEGVQKAMKDFFQQAKTILSLEELESLQNIRLSLQDCIKIGEEHNIIVPGSLDNKLLHSKYSQLTRQFQHMAKDFVHTDLINNIDHTITNIDREIDQYAKIFDVPGNMSSFFEKFGLPGSGSNMPQDNVYTQLKRQEHTLRENLSKEGLSEQEIKDYSQELIDIQNNILDYKNTHHATTRETYFVKIAQEIDRANTVLGTPLTGENLLSTLQELQKNNWNVEQLGRKQNVLMQASLSLQLLNLKESSSFTSLGYDFQSYAQFVTSLYDLESRQAVIMTQDNVPIHLNFTHHKKYRGKPLEFHNIDIDDISDLSQIRVEFELDLNNNPHAESFIRMMTGGQNSSLIKNFLPDTPGFPDTITDSSLVEMIDHNGVSYTGYLSPTDLMMTDSLEDSPYGNNSPQEQANTFILYTKPADQLHTDRNFVTQKDTSGKETINELEKAKPVYINAANAENRKSITIIDKKVTLSDGQLKALSLGHMAAQSISSDQLRDSKNPPQIEELLETVDKGLVQQLQQNTHDIGSEDTQERLSQYESLTTAEEFQKSWNNLLSGDRPCEIGTRLAIKYPQEIDGIPTLQTHPISEQLLSLTVKTIKKDQQGNIIGCTFGFDSLSRMGTCTIKDTSFEGKELEKISEIFKGGATYIDNKYKDPQDYSSVLSRLQSEFSEGVRKKTYVWNNISQFQFDGNHFLKGKEKITHFIANEKVTSADSNDDKEYKLEYSIQNLGGDTYRVTSSPYGADIANGKNKITRENISFDTTTDLTGMLLILANKNLIGYTEAEYQQSKETGTMGENTIPQKPAQRFTLGTLWKVLSGKGKDIVAALKKKLGEREEEELRFALFTEGKLLRRVSNGWLGKALGTFDLNVFDDLAGEAEASGMEYGWNKINGVLEHLSKFHAAYNANAAPGMAMATGIVEGAVASYNATQNCSMKQRWQVAGALLYSLDKMKSGYAKGLAKQPVGTYVKILFGPDYYNLFMKRYKELELKSKMNTEEGKDALEQLSMLEYNYIVDNVRGGSTLEKSPPPYGNPFYFQGIYSRTFANKLDERIGNLKSFNMTNSSDDIQKLIKTNNFNHVYNECKTHIFDMRIDDCLKELIALQSIAKTPKQADAVDQLFMTGILTGVFTNHLSKANKFDLNKAMRNSSIPYAKLIELHDAPERLQALLSLATGNGPGDFSKFTYGKDNKLYSPQDFKAYVGKQDKEGLVLSFETWFKKNRKQVMSFLHMDPKSMQTDDNLVRIRKSKEEDITIFGKKVDPTTKMYVSDMMKDFYFNRSRSASIENLNYFSGLEHTSSMIDNFFPVINRYKDGSREMDNLDHADLVWGNINEAAPVQKEEQKDKYRLAWNINNFFKMFQGIGSLSYNRTEIEMFYRYMSLAQNSSLSEYDRNRLIWFHMTQKLYALGPVPDIVKKTFIKYMQYFEKNIDNIDKELGEAHEVPSGGENFGYIFEGNNPYVYLPDATWHAMNDRDQIQHTRATERNGKLLINRDMKTMNNNAIAGGRGSSQSKAIGRTIDDEIVELRGGKVRQPLLNTTVKRGQAIAVNNKEKVDLSELADNGYESVKQKKPPQTGVKTSKRIGERNKVDEQVYEALTNMGIDPYNY